MNAISHGGVLLYWTVRLCHHFLDREQRWLLLPCLLWVKTQVMVAKAASFIQKKVLVFTFVAHFCRAWGLSGAYTLILDKFPHLLAVAIKHADVTASWTFDNFWITKGTEVKTFLSFFKKFKLAHFSWFATSFSIAWGLYGCVGFSRLFTKLGSYLVQNLVGYLLSWLCVVDFRF